MARRSRGLRRLGARHVANGDSRPTMLRLLQDCRLAPDAEGRIMVAVQYDQQWRTIWRAQREGLLDADQFLTADGRSFLTKHGVEA